MIPIYIYWIDVVVSWFRLLVFIYLLCSLNRFFGPNALESRQNFVHQPSRRYFVYDCKQKPDGCDFRKIAGRNGFEDCGYNGYNGYNRLQGKSFLRLDILSFNFLLADECVREYRSGNVTDDIQKHHKEVEPSFRCQNVVCGCIDQSLR